jgi:hypothetical protein
VAVGSHSDDPTFDDGRQADRAMSTSGFALKKPTSAPSRRGNAAALSRAALAGADEVEIAGHRYLTAHRLSSLLGVTVRTLARWNASGIGPPKIAIGKTILFDLAKLPDWLAVREIQPTRSRRRF